MGHRAATLSSPGASLRRYAGEYAAHEHGYAQVLIGLAGSLELELNGHSAYVDASCGLIVPAGVSHGYLAAAPAQVLVIDSPAAQGLERIRRFAPPAAWKAASGGIDPQAALQALGDARTLLPRRRIDLAALDARVAAALHQPWGTAQLAALCHMSPQRFHARFVELTGLTPSAYVRRRRLDTAHTLLRAGLRLEAVALQVGYASASALAFALRRDRGAGARAIRRAA